MASQSVRNLCLVALGTGLVCLTSVSAVQAQQGVGERLGQQLDKGINRLSNELREGWTSLRQTVDRMGVQGRVYSRLRWDKQIDTSEIDIESQDGGIVVLRGKVHSTKAKDKAVSLANDTVGVERVVDELTITAPQAPIEK